MHVKWVLHGINVVNFFIPHLIVKKKFERKLIEEFLYPPTVGVFTNGYTSCPTLSIELV